MTRVVPRLRFCLQRLPLGCEERPAPPQPVGSTVPHSPPGQPKLAPPRQLELRMVLCCGLLATCVASSDIHVRLGGRFGSTPAAPGGRLVELDLQEASKRGGNALRKCQFYEVSMRF